MSDIITFEQLQTATGYEKAVDIIAHLNREEVPFFTGKWGRPYTFESMFRTAKGLDTKMTVSPEPVIEV
jgi:hypothetical protein